MPFEKRTIPVLHLSFHIRSRKGFGHAALYCRLSYNSERTGEYRVGITVPADGWNRQTKSLPADHPQAETIRLKLAEVWDQHERIIMALKSQPEPVSITADLIRDGWQNAFTQVAKPRPKLPRRQATLPLMAVYRSYLNYLSLQPRAEFKANNGQTPCYALEQHLEAFLIRYRTLSLPAEKVTPGFGRQFDSYLLQNGVKPMAATKYLNSLKAALQHALLYDRIRVNGLYQFQTPRPKRAARRRYEETEVRPLGDVSNPIFHLCDQLA